MKESLGTGEIRRVTEVLVAVFFLCRCLSPCIKDDIVL